MRSAAPLQDKTPACWEGGWASFALRDPHPCGCMWDPLRPRPACGQHLGRVLLPSRPWLALSVALSRQR